MSFFSHVLGVVRRAVLNPVGSIKKAIHNPEAALLSKNLRTSRGWHRIGRPVVKVAAGVVVGGLTGGVGLAAGGLTFSGVSAAGAVAGGLASAAGGGTTSGAFNPVKNLVAPAAAGLVVGNVARYASGSRFGHWIAGEKSLAKKAAVTEIMRVKKRARQQLSVDNLARHAGAYAGAYVNRRRQKVGGVNSSAVSVPSQNATAQNATAQNATAQNATAQNATGMTSGVAAKSNNGAIKVAALAVATKVLLTGTLV